MLIQLGVIILNALAMWGLGFILFRDWDDFVQSFKGMFGSGYIGSPVTPTRAFLWFFLVITMALSSMAFLNKTF